MLLLGTLAAQAAAIAPVPTSTSEFELIETETLTSTTASVSFDVSGLGSTYQHLQLRVVGRTNRSATGDIIKLNFNSDFSSNYRWHYLYGNGSSALSTTGSSTYIETYRIAGANAPADTYGVAIIDVLDAFSSSKKTTIRNLAGLSGGATGIFLQSGLWDNTASLTQIDCAAIGSYVANSRFALYGYKVAA